MDNKLSVKGDWSGPRGSNHIPGTAEARVISFCTQVNYIKS